MDQTKTQEDRIPVPADVPAGVIISPDTLRDNRIPPGQSRTKKWPILDASGAPDIAPEKWRLEIGGLVQSPTSFDWTAFDNLPKVRVFSDFHCVTRWSRLGNIWEGVSTRELIGRAGGARPEARFVVAWGYDGNWSTNLPLDEFLAEDSLVAMKHDDVPLSLEHGGPARLLIPRLYAWKSAKWLSRIELVDKDKAGFWERNGYHMHGDPWTQERYGW